MASANKERMTRDVRQHIDSMLHDAEKATRCCAPISRAEREHMRKAQNAGIVINTWRGLYARPAYWAELRTTEQTRHIIRGLALLHSSWVFAGPTAAVMHGLDVPNSFQKSLYLATTRKTHYVPSDGFIGVIVSNDEAAEIESIRATSLERTVYDSVRVMGFRASFAIVDSALRANKMKAEELADRVSEACGHRSDIARVRAVIALGDGLSENGGESIARATMLELGFRPPVLQRKYPNPDDSNGEYRVDYAWDLPSGTLLGELDGNGKYLDPLVNGGVSAEKAIEDEHRRQSNILAQKNVASMVRFSFGDVCHPETFAKILKRAGVPRTHEADEQVLAAGGTLRHVGC